MTTTQHPTCPVCGTSAPLTHCCPGCGACSGGRTEAARYPTREAFWLACDNPVYLTWWLRAAGLVGEVGSPERLRLVRCVAEIAETALVHIRDEHTLAVATATVQVTIAYTEGEATIEDVCEHRRECWSAAAADAAADAAAAAAAAADADCCDIIRAHYDCPPLVDAARRAA